MQAVPGGAEALENVPLGPNLTLKLFGLRLQKAQAPKQALQMTLLLGFWHARNGAGLQR